MPCSFTSVPAYLEYTTFSPSCKEDGKNVTYVLEPHLNNHRLADQQTWHYHKKTKTHLDSLCCSCSLHMTLCRLLLCTRWKQDAPNRFLLTNIHLHEDTLAHWSNCLVLHITR